MMIKTKSILGALGLLAMFAMAPAMAAEGTTQIPPQTWSFSGPFGKFDKDQLQRGFQVFREVCSNCHSAKLLAFRNLDEPGGPEFSEGQVKALAAQYEVTEAEATGGKRAAVPADHWPSPFATDQDARDANGGALPPDFSVLAKARGAAKPFPYWILNYFTAYSEGGPDYIHALLNGYHDTVPEGTVDGEGKPYQLPEGKFFNDYFPGHGISMPPPLADGQVTYGEPEEGAQPVPATREQYSHDVAAFMMWLADPHQVERKEAGFRVIAFLLVFSVLMYLVKRRLWARIH